MNESKRNQKLGAVIGLIVIVAAIGIGVVVTNGDKDTANSMAITSPTATATTTATATATNAPTAGSQTYKDGTYTASGSYSSPGGEESIKITVTLAGDKVTSTSAVAGATDDEAQRYQAQFINSYRSQVVGKSVDSISLSRVSGSSLTSNGFNQALANIKSQAKA